MAEQAGYLQSCKPGFAFTTKNVLCTHKCIPVQCVCVESEIEKVGVDGVIVNIAQLIY